LHGDAYTDAHAISYTYSCHAYTYAYTDPHNCPYPITDAFCQLNANRHQSHAHRYVST